MLVSTYSALMKVYAYCDLHGKAGDLYDELLEQGLEPDAITIITCIMKSVQGYMLRIRAAGRDKDVDGAFADLTDQSGLIVRL